MANYLTSDHDLSGVADAIRAAGHFFGTLSFPDGFIQALQEIPDSSSSPIVITSMVTTAEMNSFSALNAMDAKFKYERSCVIFVILGNTAAVGGSAYTNNNYVMKHNGTNIIEASLNQKSGRSAPNTMAFDFESTKLYSCSSTQWIHNDGRYNFRSETASVMIPAGAFCLTVEIPSSLQNGQLDLTLFGT